MSFDGSTQSPQGTSMCKMSNAAKSVTQEPPSKQTSSENSLDDPFEFRDPNLWRSRIFESEDLNAAKKWYQQNVTDQNSRKCPVCLSLGSDLAELVRSKDLFKFTTAVGGIMLLFVGSFLAAMLKSDQSSMGHITIQKMITITIGVTVFIVLFVYWVAQRDSEERTSVAFKLMEFSRINESNTSVDNQEFCSQHERLVPSELE